MALLRYAQLEIDVPAGWEGRGFARLQEVWGEQTYAVLHLANFALPARVEDYGGGAVETMRARDVFVSVLEFGPESAGTALFAPSGVPKLSIDSFDRNLLQRGLPGQSGAQQFFSADGRPYCLYVVLGEHLLRARAAPEVNRVLERLRFSA